VNVVVPVASSVPVPSSFEPSMNATIPVGMPAPGATAPTVAVKVIDWPKTPEEGLALREVAVSAWLTLWSRTVEVLVVKSVSPLYTTVIDVSRPPA
jgi:hypothetical protein